MSGSEPLELPPSLVLLREDVVVLSTTGKAGSGRARRSLDSGLLKSWNILDDELDAAGTDGSLALADDDVLAADRSFALGNGFI